MGLLWTNAVGRPPTDGGMVLMEVADQLVRSLALLLLFAPNDAAIQRLSPLHIVQQQKGGARVKKSGERPHQEKSPFRFIYLLYHTSSQMTHRSEI